MTGTPHLLAEGSRTGQVYSHVGYVVGGTIEMTLVPARPGLTAGLCGVGLALLLLAVAARERWRPAARCGVLVAASVALVAGMDVGRARKRVLLPETITALQQIERLSASTEAQASALGRWPTPEEWHAEHGEPVGPRGKAVHFELAPPPNTRDHGDLSAPWKAYAIWADDRGLAPDYLWCDSRVAGADGLFGTPDDEEVVHWLRASYLQEKVWPHARPPRDPKAKLPGWPTGMGKVVR
ncbi:MAG: hypothetical protein HZB16_06265 [Armatimonadetes bacterium]|nr:hypothetical protein [Armatimonadota bacterium]